MRYKIVMQQYKHPYQTRLRLDDGRTMWRAQDRLTKLYPVGSTGTVIQTPKGLQLKVDAIDGELV